MFPPALRVNKQLGLRRSEVTNDLWVFTVRPDNTTFVSITNSGFTGTGDEMVKKALESTEGFTFVLAGLKALLEHNVELNLVRDRFPAAVAESS
jgi:hypothetical protein